MKPINVIISTSAASLTIAAGAFAWSRVTPSDAAAWLARLAFGVGVAVAFLPLIALAALLAYEQ